MIIRSQKKLGLLGMIQATKEHPFMCCKTCGRTTNKVIIKHSNTLRRDPNPTKRKTWRRTVKPSDTYKTTYNRMEVKQKALYFSYYMLTCIEKKHRITIRKAPFSAKLIKELV